MSVEVAFCADSEYFQLRTKKISFQFLPFDNGNVEVSGMILKTISHVENMSFIQQSIIQLSIGSFGQLF